MTKPCCPKCNCKGVAHDSPNMTYFGAEHCGNPNCECHVPTEKESWEVEFEGRFGHFWSKDGYKGNVVGGPFESLDGNKWVVIDKDSVLSFLAEKIGEAERVGFVKGYNEGKVDGRKYPFR